MKTKYLIAMALASVWAALDQWTKQLILDAMQIYEMKAFGEYFNLVHVRNNGAAFSLLASQPSSVTVPLFLTMGGIALAVIVYYLRQAPDELRVVPVALGSILGGAVGNLIDRVRHGNVVDFLDAHIGNIHWPAFNVADVAVAMGVILLAIEILWRHQDAFDADTSVA